MASYNRKRLAMYFDNEPSAECPKKSHAPDFEKVKWDKTKVLEDLTNVVTQNKKIVWTSFAKDHEIEGNNN